MVCCACLRPEKAAFFGMHVISHSRLPFCKSNGTKYIDARKNFPLNEFPYRTTLCLTASGWELVERCARYAFKHHSRLDALNVTEAITILSRELIKVEELGTSQFSTSQPSGSQHGRNQNVGLHLGHCQLTPIYNGWTSIVIWKGQPFCQTVRCYKFSHMHCRKLLRHVVGPPPDINWIQP